MKTKKIFIFTLIFSFLFIFTTSCFATVDYLGKQLPDFPDEYYNYKNKVIVTYSHFKTYSLFLFNSDDVYYSISSDTEDSIHFPSCKRYDWDPNNSPSWVASSSDFSNGVSLNLIYKYSEGYLYGKDILHSTVNIKYSNSDEVFFYQTPLLPTTITLSAISGTVWQTLAPLITMILVVVVFYIGFLKGYRAFLRLLQRG